MHIELKQETETERADREDFARAMDVARLQGRLEAFAMAMTECSKTTRHEDGSMGAWIRYGGDGPEDPCECLCHGWPEDEDDYLG